MAVSMRTRPVVTGNDANRFIERVRKNNLAMDRRMMEMAKGKDQNERKDIYRHLTTTNKTY